MSNQNVPKTIHYCWFGNAPKPALVQACLNSWKQYAPDYDIVEWNEKNFPTEDPILRKAKTKKQWAFVADFARLRILKNEGGFYLDTDMELIRSLDDLRCFKFVAAYESTEWINAGFLGSIARGKTIAYLEQEWIKQHEQKPYYTEIPKIITPYLRTVEGSDEATILGSKSFYPYNPYDVDREIKTLMYGDVTKDTFAIHHWMHSWSAYKRPILHRLLRRLKFKFARSE